MVNSKYLLIGVPIVIIGIVVAVTLFPSEEKRVKKRDEKEEFAGDDLRKLEMELRMIENKIDRLGK